MTTSKQASKKAATLIVTKNDGKSVAVKRSPLKDLQTLIDLQESLLSKYIEAGGEGFAALMLDDEFSTELATFINLIPLADGSGNLAFEELDEDWEQLQQLVFNGNYSIDNANVMELSPSKFSKLNFLPFTKVAVPHLQEFLRKYRKALQDTESVAAELATLGTES